MINEELELIHRFGEEDGRENSSTIDMATKQEIQKWLPDAFQRFAAVFPFAVDATFELVLCNRETCSKVHREIIAKSGAKPSEYIENTDGEMIIGPNGCYMLLYPWNIPDEHHLRRVFWHELGHRCDYHFNSAFRDHVTYHFDEDDLICGGYTIWSEFIAEMMYYEVADDEPQRDYIPVLLELEQLLFQSFPGGSLFPYQLGHYAAKVMGDPTVDLMQQQYPGQLNIGLDILRDEVADRVIDVLSILDEQMGLDEFWVASEKFMKKLGGAFNELWDEAESGDTFHL